MTLTPAQQEAQLAADAQALATLDLATLQTFQTLATNSGSTVGQLQTAMAALPASLGDPGRQAAVTSMRGAYQDFLGQLATLISQTNALANP